MTLFGVYWYSGPHDAGQHLTRDEGVARALIAEKIAEESMDSVQLVRFRALQTDLIINWEPGDAMPVEV